ncbi:MAG: hypothetical protein CVT88_07110 [Candidatus Altiarchaeales archaeon HGW-Altiarchaeales-1]|nr:MAG: hypothetical protein CVT88_07110 [Candidatus Altiarchaeales archaeon HGW-Altiarchaeales-1]
MQCKPHSIHTFCTFVEKRKNNEIFINLGFDETLIRLKIRYLEYIYNNLFIRFSFQMWGLVFQITVCG